MDTNVNDGNGTVDPNLNTNEDGSDSQQALAQYEADARRMGWKPKDEFPGAPERWVDAKTYMERANDVLPLVKAENKALRAEIARIQADASKALEISEAAHQREISQLTADLDIAKESRKDAIAESDGDKFEKAEAEVRDLEKQLVEAKAKLNKAPENQIPPRLQAWLDREDNGWIKSDPEVLYMVNAMAALPKYTPLRGQHEVMWDAVAADVKKMRQAAFSPPPRDDLNRPGPASSRPSDSVASPRAAKRSYEALLPEYRNQCDRQYKEFGIKSKPEDWRKRYVDSCPDDCFKS